MLSRFVSAIMAKSAPSLIAWGIQRLPTQGVETAMRNAIIGVLANTDPPMRAVYIETMKKVSSVINSVVEGLS